MNQITNALSWIKNQITEFFSLLIKGIKILTIAWVVLMFIYGNVQLFQRWNQVTEALNIQAKK